MCTVKLEESKEYLINVSCVTHAGTIFVALVPPDADPISHVLMDFKTTKKDNQTGERYILLLVDLLTKYVWYQLSERKPAAVVLKFLKERLAEWESKGMKPKILHTDNGGEFANVDINKWCDQNHIEFRHGLPGHPQAQGAVERVVGTVITELKERVPDLNEMNLKHCDWVDQYAST